MKAKSTGSWAKSSEQTFGYLEVNQNLPKSPITSSLKWYFRHFNDNLVHSIWRVTASILSDSRFNDNLLLAFHTIKQEVLLNQTRRLSNIYQFNLQIHQKSTSWGEGSLWNCTQSHTVRRSRQIKLVDLRSHREGRTHTFWVLSLQYRYLPQIHQTWSQP